MTRPLRSTPITRASPLLRAGPPAHPASVLDPFRGPPVGTLPLPTHLAGGQVYRDAPSHVPCASSRPGSRRLHAGHHLASRSGTRQAHPGPNVQHPGFDVTFPHNDTSAAILLRSSSWSPPDPITQGLFRIAHHERHSAAAACGGLQAPPEQRLRRAYLHLTHSTVSVLLTYLEHHLHVRGTQR